MKSHTEPRDDQPLAGLLREWTVTTPLPPRFQEQVWQRIALSEEHARTEPRRWDSFARWLELVLPRPKVALAYVATLLVVGVAAGSFTAQMKSNHLDDSLSSRYIQSISPYQEPPP